LLAIRTVLIHAVAMPQIEWSLIAVEPCQRISALLGCAAACTAWQPCLLRTARASRSAQQARLCQCPCWFCCL
jgi:hypothetical protein